jgi:predicted AAA+ superfamily ATPase
MQYWLRMVIRPFWIAKIEDAWKRRPIVWVSGVRRVGKTMLCRSLERTEYFDCELPRVRRMMDDPEAFWEGLRGRRVVLDEIHRLADPTELLKIAADHFPDIRVVATGSSTLQASGRFRDTLAGRKMDIWLTPLMSDDLAAFGNKDIPHRLRQGGLPPFFLNPEIPDRDYQEWMDSFWARDIQELFRLERRASFQRFLELLFARSGGLFEATAYAAPCEISRTTVGNYLGALEATRVAHVIRPYSTHRTTEIVAAPKVYGFDTGFVCYFRGWQDLRAEDLGALWEHLVLNEIHGRSPDREVRYWRDKRGHEVDFVLAGRGRQPVAIECKWSARNFDPLNLQAFRHRYPPGENWLVARDVDRPHRLGMNGLPVDCLGLDDLARRLERS